MHPDDLVKALLVSRGIMDVNDGMMSFDQLWENVYLMKKTGKLLPTRLQAARQLVNTNVNVLHVSCTIHHTFANII
jgi:hypothetical protein